MPKNSIDSLFNKVGSSWGKVAAAESVSNLPAGNYTARLDSIKFIQTKNGELAISYSLVVTSGKFAKKKVSKVARLTTEQNLSYAKMDLAALGFDPEDIDTDDIKGSLGKIFKKLTGKIVEIRSVDTQKEDQVYHNIYFVGLSTEDVGTEDEDDDAADEDTDEDAADEEDEDDDEDADADDDDDEDGDGEEDEDEDDEEESPTPSKKSKAPKAKLNAATVNAMSKDEIAAAIKVSGDRAIRGFAEMSVKAARKAYIVRLGL